ncbi:hypothetical protein WP12_12950 [Sphingomonas sp. SRS2]|nr:hypothetical protein WP12_12950 [Sphingomonas sp. SRS2]
MHDRATYLQVAQLHAAAIHQGFLPMLGAEFLALLYQSIDECAESVLFVEREAGRVIGFVAGAKSMRSIYRQMIGHWYRLARALIPIVLKPRHIWRIVEILLYNRADGGGPNLPTYELLSIAVDDGFRGRGVARRLYMRLVDHFHAMDASGFRIAVGSKLDAAHAFYRGMGAVEVGEVEMHQGKNSVIYVHWLQTNRLTAS